MTAVSPRAAEVRALAATLWFLPPPGRGFIADKLHGLGVRVHEELATLVLEREGPASMGNHAPMRVIAKESVNEGLDALRQVNPGLAAQIDAARNDPERSAQIDAAVTNAQKAAIAKDFGIDVADALKVIDEHLTQVADEAAPQP